jgi:hypothetical protein
MHVTTGEEAWGKHTLPALSMHVTCVLCVELEPCDRLTMQDV